MAVVNNRLCIVLLVFIGMVMTACGDGDTDHKQKQQSKATDDLAAIITPTPVGQLPGWRFDTLDHFFTAFTRSCSAISKQSQTWSVGGHAVKSADLARVCDQLPAKNPQQFVAHHFVALPIQGSGLMTGYYEPVIDGSLTRQTDDQAPLYALPDDLINVDLSRFDPDLSGRIRGKIQDNQLIPYDTRAMIDEKGLSGRAEKIVYINDPVDAFFLHVQGSGLISLPDGDMIRVGYAGKNGHPYRSIGRYLINHHGVEKSGLSMTKISDWLVKNPDQMSDVLHHNPSYIFFRQLPIDAGPLGAQGVKLTPARSLAVDMDHWPLGLPFWVAIDDHDDFPRLMVAQDTGSAIKGQVRGDIFWGRSMKKADAMADRGKFWVLIPKISVADAAP